MVKSTRLNAIDAALPESVDRSSVLTDLAAAFAERYEA